MNSSDTEEITDEIIGEAVLALLKTNRPITTPTLLVRLRLMQATESDRQRAEERWRRAAWRRKLKKSTDCPNHGE